MTGRRLTEPALEPGCRWVLRLRQSRPMKTSRKLLVVLAGASVFIVSSLTAAIAQTPVDPSTTPTENTGGWVFSMAQLLFLLGVATVLFLIVMYMRYAPRFAKDEEGLKRGPRRPRAPGPGASAP